MLQLSVSVIELYESFSHKQKHGSKNNKNTKSLTQSSDYINQKVN